LPNGSIQKLPAIRFFEEDEWLGKLIMVHIHIVGSGPRTGTTLLAEAMKFCCNIDYASEHEDKLFARPRQPVDLFLTKYPSDLFVVWPSLRVDPRLYVICLLRDPRDAVVSQHGKDKEQYWSTLRYWQAFTPLIKAYQHHPRFIVIRYEDFACEPDKIQQLLINRIPALEQRHKFSDYHLVAKPSVESQHALKQLRPISGAGIGSWQQHLPRIVQQVQAHGDISDSLIDFGYEKDNKWVETLATIEHSKMRSALPEYFSSAELRRRRKGRYFEALKRCFGY
jgi:hypothetical protein